MPYDENGPVAASAVEPDGATEPPMQEDSASDGDESLEETAAPSGS